MAALPPEDDELDDFLSVTGDGAAEEAHPILTAEEVQKARASARKHLETERRAAALADVEKRELDRLRREEGLTSGITDEDKLLYISIDLPEWSPSINVNGMPYWHGTTVQVPRHVFRSLQEQMQSAWRSHDQTEGKSIAQMLRPRNTVLNGRTGAIENAPRRFDA